MGSEMCIRDRQNVAFWDERSGDKCMQRPQRYKNADALQPFSTFHIDHKSLLGGILRVMERLKPVKKFIE